MRNLFCAEKNMSENEEAQEAPEKKSGLLGKLIVWGVIFVLGAGAGAATPMLMGSNKTSEHLNVNAVGVKLMDFPEPDDKVAFIEFDEMVVNLNDPRFSNYLTCSITLQVAKSQEIALTKLIEEKSAILKNWLIAHVRDKKPEEVRGKFGHNMLRREIHGKFNELLFTDGIERIQDVLFKDFKVQ